MRPELICGVPRRVELHREGMEGMLLQDQKDCKICRSGVEESALPLRHQKERTFALRMRNDGRIKDSSQGKLRHKRHACGANTQQKRGFDLDHRKDNCTFYKREIRKSNSAHFFRNVLTEGKIKVCTEAPAYSCHA